MTHTNTLLWIQNHHSVDKIFCPIWYFYIPCWSIKALTKLSIVSSWLSNVFTAFCCPHKVLVLLNHVFPLSQKDFLCLSSCYCIIRAFPHETFCSLVMDLFCPNKAFSSHYEAYYSQIMDLHCPSLYCKLSTVLRKCLLSHVGFYHCISVKVFLMSLPWFIVPAWFPACFYKSVHFPT